jgi:hypothetical protein
MTRFLSSDHIVENKSIEELLAFTGDENELVKVMKDEYETTFAGSRSENGETCKPTHLC